MPDGRIARNRPDVAAAIAARAISAVAAVGPAGAAANVVAAIPAPEPNSAAKREIGLGLGFGAERIAARSSAEFTTCAAVLAASAATVT